MLPLIKRYQAMFILLPIGDDGIPQTAEGRIREVEKAYKTLSAAGIGKESILVDGLVMAVSSDPNAAAETLKVIRWCSDNGFNTALGISNGSFGSAGAHICQCGVSCDGHCQRFVGSNHEPE